MVRLKNFVLVTLLISIGLTSLAEVGVETRDGYFLDRRGDVKNSYIRPPHPENIPIISKKVQPVVDFESYYKVNGEGYRGREDKLPLVPGYTENYSIRKNTVYTKEDYINVWCSGEKHVGKVDCMNRYSAISFFPLSAWARAIPTAAWRARKHDQQGVAALYVEDLNVRENDMYEAKEWAKKWGAKVVFISIDAGIPEEWIQ
jgi:hypothetical protein